MKREVLRIKNRETAVQISNNRVKAIRNKDIVKVGARVYDKGFIGVAGQYGESNLDELFEKAKENLRFNIKYPNEILNNLDIQVKGESNPIIIEEVETLVKGVEKVVKTYGFVASGTIKFIYNEIDLSNEEKLNCIVKTNKIEVGIILKEIGTPNIFDTTYFSSVKEVNKDIILKGVEDVCKAHKNPANIPVSKNGKIRCIFGQDEQILSFFINELNGQQIGSNSSFFNNKFGEKLFNENVTLYPSNDIEEGGHPFDLEGTLIKGEEDALIEKGILRHGYSDKRTSEKYGLKNTGNGFGDFNGVPTLSGENLNLKRGSKTLKELIDGQQSIFIASAGGGDFTNDGGYGTPVQIAYLFDGDNFIGKIPEISLKSHIYDMFGKDFIGVASDGLYEGSLDKLVVMDMKLN